MAKERKKKEIDVWLLIMTSSNLKIEPMWLSLYGNYTKLWTFQCEYLILTYFDFSSIYLPQDTKWEVYSDK